MNTLPAPDLPEWLLKQLPFKRYVVPVGALKMHVMEQGPADGYPVLMVHGNPTWGYLYRKVAKALSPYPLRIILPDLIGLGFSDRIRAEEHTLSALFEYVRDERRGSGLAVRTRDGDYRFIYEPRSELDLAHYLDPLPRSFRKRRNVKRHARARDYDVGRKERFGGVAAGLELDAEGL